MLTIGTMKRQLFNQVVLAFSVYIGVDISPVIDASEIILSQIKFTVKKRIP